jgi:uncharacterized membrane protein YhaH (DUF805 family)
MRFCDAVNACLTKYATFSGRACRSEFWYFYLFCLLVSWSATLVDLMLNMGETISMVVNSAILIPSLAASSRRLHDTGRSGWWVLLIFTMVGGIPLIVWWAREGKKEAHEEELEFVAVGGDHV